MGEFPERFSSSVAGVISAGTANVSLRLAENAHRKGDTPIRILPCTTLEATFRETDVTPGSTVARALRTTSVGHSSAARIATTWHRYAARRYTKRDAYRTSRSPAAVADLSPRRQFQLPVLVADTSLFPSDFHWPAVAAIRATYPGATPRADYL